MTAPLHICFRLLAPALILALLTRAAEVSGKITVAPENSKRNLSDIVIWLAPDSPLNLQPVSSEHAVLLQKNKMFLPHVLPVRAGTIVDFPNDDPIFHSAFSNYDGQLFDLALYPPGTTRSVRFRRPGVVRVFCNIHPSMSAVILVLETPYFERAQKNGAYRLSNVPFGSYTLHIFDERAASPVPALPVTVNENQVMVPQIRVSETRNVQLPHKNKYGQDYPPDSQREDYNDVLK